MRALRGLWWLFGFSTPAKAVSPAVAEQCGSPKDRKCRTVRKRLHRATRLLLAILPRRIQSALGYPVCTSIGCTVSPGNLIPLLQIKKRFRIWDLKFSRGYFSFRGALFPYQALWQRLQEKAGWPGWRRGGRPAFLGGCSQSGTGRGRPRSWSRLWGLLFSCLYI